MKATASAILLLGLGLVGASLGPFLVGAVSDALHPHFGAQSLRYALMLACVTNLWAAAHFMIASRRLESDLAIARDAR